MTAPHCHAGALSLEQAREQWLARLGTSRLSDSALTAYDIVLSNSRGPQTLENFVRELGPHARAATTNRRGLTFG